MFYSSILRIIFTYFFIVCCSLSVFSRAGGGSFSGGGSGGGGYHGGYGYYGYGYHGRSVSLTHNEVIALLIGVSILFLGLFIYAARITYLLKNNGKLNKEKLKVRFEHDAFWNHDKIINYTYQFYIELQEAWSKGDLTSIKQKMSPQLYRQYTSILNRYKSRGLSNIIEGIEIKEASVIYFDDYIDDSKDSIAILIKGELKDYFAHIGYIKNVEKQKFKDAFVFVRSNDNLILTEIINEPNFEQITKPKNHIEK